MAYETWLESPGTNDYNTASNWSLGFVPGYVYIAFFDSTKVPSLSINSGTQIRVGEWIFTPNATQYNFTIGPNNTVFEFIGEGIVINGGSATITVLPGSSLNFWNASSAGKATINSSGSIAFLDVSTGGIANITNNANVSFNEYSSAGSATIHTLTGSSLGFSGNATGGNAQLNTDVSGTVDFASAGPFGNNQLTVGSIEGAGTYNLGADQLTVGLKGISTNVSGLVDGSGGSLVIDAGTLTLGHADNTYSGGTRLEGGILDVAAVGAAGTGDIAFQGAGKATLKIDNAGLSGHVFGSNDIDSFGKHDVLDITGLHFHAGATATYHKATHHLTVHSGHVTDTLTLLSPHGMHFAVANDGHGGSKVTLGPPAHTATVASLSAHDLGGEPLATDSAIHSGDFLFVA